MFELFLKNYNWTKDVRSVTVRAINLTEINEPAQLDFIMDYTSKEKRENAEEAIEKIRKKYGISAIDIARLV